MIQYCGQRVIARLDNATLPVCIDYNFGEPTLINAYRVFGNSEKTNKGVYSAPQRQPKSFSFWGSVDGTDWVKLDERKNETAWQFGEMRQYEFANTTAYTRYRIAFYECNGPDASTGESYVDFVLDSTTAAAGFKLRKDATGLRLVNTRGFMVIVR